MVVVDGVVLLWLVVLACVLSPVYGDCGLHCSKQGGMTSSSFRGMPHIQEIQCSGESLEPDTDVFSVTLYIASRRRQTMTSANTKSATSSPQTIKPSSSPNKEENNQLIAVANLKDQQCRTSDRFSACVLSDVDSRHTKLTSLVLGLAAREQVEYGCNLTVLRGGTHGGVLSWTYVVSGKGLTSRLLTSVPTFQVLECSGQALDTSQDLLSLTIFTASRNGGRDVTLVSVNMRAGQCSIAAEGRFSLCRLDDANSRMTSLMTLVPNPRVGERGVEYGCNATGYQAPGRVHTKTWSLVVSAIRE